MMSRETRVTYNPRRFPQPAVNRDPARCGAEDEPFGDAVCQLPVGHEGPHAAEMGSTTVAWPQRRVIPGRSEQ